MICGNKFQGIFSSHGLKNFVCCMYFWATGLHTLNFVLYQSIRVSQYFYNLPYPRNGKKTCCIRYVATSDMWRPIYGQILTFCTFHAMFCICLKITPFIEVCRTFCPQTFWSGRFRQLKVQSRTFKPNTNFRFPTLSGFFFLRK